MSLDCAYRVLVSELLAGKESAEDVALIDKQVYRLRIERVPAQKVAEAINEHFKTTT